MKPKKYRLVGDQWMVGELETAIHAAIEDYTSKGIDHDFIIVMTQWTQENLLKEAYRKIKHRYKKQHRGKGFWCSFYYGNNKYATVWTCRPDYLEDFWIELREWPNNAYL